MDPPVKRICVHLTDEQMKLLRMWGRGDLAAGLRWLIDAAKHFVQKRPAAPNADIKS
jgi:hypothetical protein